MNFQRGIGFILKRTMSSSCNLENFACNSRKILGAAFNFMDGIKEKNGQIPKAPVVFLKPPSSIIQEGKDIVIPKVFNKVAYEVELGVIIGKQCKNVSKKDALSYVGGYCLALDMTAQCEMAVARTNSLPWSMGKGFDTSTPVSRFLRPEDIQDPHNMDLWLKVNGQLMQSGNTSDMVYNICDLIEYCSKYMTLEPNDIILTGTPKNAQPIKDGDIIECGLGDLIQMKFKCVNEK